MVSGIYFVVLNPGCFFSDFCLRVNITLQEPAHHLVHRENSAITETAVTNLLQNPVYQEDETRKLSAVFLCFVDRASQYNLRQ